MGAAIVVQNVPQRRKWARIEFGPAKAWRKGWELGVVESSPGLIRSSTHKTSKRAFGFCSYKVKVHRKPWRPTIFTLRSLRMAWRTRQRCTILLRCLEVRRGGFCLDSANRRILQCAFSTSFSRDVLSSCICLVDGSPRTAEVELLELISLV